MQYQIMQYQFKTNPIQNHFKGKYQIIINAIPNYAIPI